MLLYPRRRRKAEINIVPLVDVLTVLIFFFLILMSVERGEVRALQITPPTFETAGNAGPGEDLVVAITATGEYYLNQTRVEASQFPLLIAEVAAISKERRVRILADEDTPLKHLAHVMDSCRKVGLERLQLQTR